MKSDWITITFTITNQRIILIIMQQDHHLNFPSPTSNNSTTGDSIRDSISVPSTSSPAKNINDTGEESETNLKELLEDSNEDDGNNESWVTWFCNKKGNEFFCQVDDSYILNDTNLIGLSSQVPCYDYALDLVLDVESSHDEFTEEQNDLVEWAAEMLYGLVHARYILTAQGMSAMVEKYRRYDFGICPRFHCNKQRCLPVGESDTPRSRTVKIYCPKCEDIYVPDSKHQENIDGAYFGTTFPHMFLLNYEHLKPQRVSQSYAPRIYGFKISK